MKQIVMPIDLEMPPREVFRKLRRTRPCFWLDSSREHPQWATRSYLGFDPFLSIRFKAGIFSISGLEEKQFASPDPLHVLRDYCSRFRMRATPDFPLGPGAAGYLGYELGGYLEPASFRRKDDPALDEMRFDFYQFMLGYEHASGSWSLLALEDAALPGRTREYVDQVHELAGDGFELGPASFATAISSNFSQQQYLEAVLRVKKYIEAGDVYQVNLSRRFGCQYKGDAAGLYLRLRETNPGSHAAALLYPDLAVLSSSPELFLRKRGRQVTTRPIKGTRPRGATAEEDERMKSELLASEKDCAELTMIVDLERNDLGRVCDCGSVEVESLSGLESYSSVHHLAATVSGRLSRDKDVFDLLKACFPGGSITGAPKLRAMEIIDELEPDARGPYTGSIGMIGFSGDLEMNIAIRTIILQEDHAWFPAGGGIVWDSVPEMEYAETWSKAQAMWHALSRGQGRSHE